MKQKRLKGFLRVGKIISKPKNSSRFMPNVKFCVVGHQDELEKAGLGGIYSTKSLWGFDFAITNNKGSDVMCGGCARSDVFPKYPSVSIYEAIPELVPDGMVYVKEVDDLVDAKWYKLVLNLGSAMQKPIEHIREEVKALLSDKQT